MARGVGSSGARFGLHSCSGNQTQLAIRDDTFTSLQALLYQGVVIQRGSSLDLSHSTVVSALTTYTKNCPDRSARLETAIVARS